jgi:tetratricopeptide (TPR) repeat protein
MKSKPVQPALPALALVSMVLVAGCGGADARRVGHMAKGNEYFASENYDKARVEFQNVLQIAPNDAEARFMVGRISEKLGNLREAANAYQGAIDVDPDHVPAVANLGRMYVFAGAPERALETIKTAIEKNPKDPELLTVRGAARIQQQDREGALADAQAAVAVAPNNENAVALLASIHRQSGELKLAAEVIQGALKANPKSVDLRQVLAAIYSEAREPELAEQQMRDVVALRPEQRALRYQLALFLARNNKIEAAEKVFEEAIAQEPDAVEPRLAYIEFLAAQGAADRAEKTLRGYISKYPQELDLQLGLGALQQREGRNDAAIATYEALIAADERDRPASLAARNRIAAIRLAAGRSDDASKLVDEVLKLNARDNDALVLRSNILLARGDAAGAIADLRTVLRDQPTAVPLLRSLARAHIANDEPALAEENLRAAREVAPADVQVRLDLAQLLAQTGRAAQAVTLLEETVLASPDDPAAREMLVKAYISNSDLDQALKAAEDLKLLQPRAAAGFYLAGLIARGQNRIDDADREFRAALERQPDAPDVMMAWSSVQVTRGRTGDAIGAVQAAVERNPGATALQNLLGELYLQSKNYPRAITTLEGVIAADRTSWIAHRNLALAHIASGDAKRGEAAYVRGIEQAGQPFALVSDLAVIYERQKRPDEAIALYEAFFRTNPRVDAAANNLAMLLVTYRRDAASLDRARDLTAGFASSTVGAFLDTYGWVRLQRGETQDALAALERAAQLVPESRVVRYHLAMAQKAAGQKDRALQNLEQALEGTSGFAGAEQARLALQELRAGSAAKSG